MPIVGVHHNVRKDQTYWSIEIEDPDGTGIAEIEFGTPDAMRVRILGGNNEPLPGIYGLSAEVEFLIQTEADELKYVDLVTGVTKDWKIRIYKEDVLYLGGYINPGGVETEDISLPYVVKLEVQDATQSLRGLTSQNRLLSGTRSIMYFITRCIEEMGVAELYDPDKTDFLKVSVAWNYMDSEVNSSADNPLEYLYLNTAAFNPVGKDALDMYEVFDRICQTFCLQFRQIGGGFHLFNMNLMDGSGIPAFYYNTQLQFQGAYFFGKTIEVDYEVDDVYATLKGGVFGWLEPWREVDAFIQLDRETQINQTGREWSWEDVPPGYETFGPVAVQYGDALRIRGIFTYQTTLRVPFDPVLGIHPYFKQHRYVWTVWIRYKVDDAADWTYAIRKVNMLPLYPNGTGTFTNPSYVMQWNAIWGGDEDTFYVVSGVVDGTSVNTILPNGVEYPPNDLTEILTHASSDVFVNELVVSIGIPDLDPGIDSSLLVELDVRLDKIVTFDGLDIKDELTDYTFKWWFRDVRVDIVDSVVTPIEETQSRPIELHYKRFNEARGISKKEHEFFFGDVVNNRLGLKYKDADGVFQYTQNDRWEFGHLSGDEVAFGDLIAHNLMYYRGNPRRLYYGTLYTHDYRPWYMVKYCDRLYYMLNGSIKTGLDETEATFYEVVGGISGISDAPGDVVVVTPQPGSTEAEGITPVDSPPHPVLIPDVDGEGLVSGGNIEDGVAYQAIPVHNPNGVVAGQGEYLVITNRQTGVTDIVLITDAAGLDGSLNQTVAISEKTFNQFIPQGSPITVSTVKDFHWVNYYYEGDGVSFAFDAGTYLPDPSILTPAGLNRVLRVYRTGSRCRWKTPTVSLTDFEISSGVSVDQIVFRNIYPLQTNEWVLIEVYEPKI